MKIKKILSFLCIIFLLGSAVAHAENKKELTEKQWQNRRSFIEDNMRKLGSQGPDKVNEFLEKNDMVKAKSIISAENNIIMPNSANGNITLYGIDAYFDHGSNKYLVKGFWKWNSLSYVDADPGPVEGISLAMCQSNWDPVTNYIFSSNPGGMAVYDQSGSVYSNVGNVTEIDRSGVCYTYTDYWTGLRKYVGYSGSVWFWLDQKPSQLPFYVKMDYIHSYNTGSFSGIGFQWQPQTNPVLTMSWSTVPATWPKSNQATFYGWPNY